MQEQYNPQQIEQETQQYWDDQQVFNVTEDLSKEKFYCLSMLPYPSGKLHMGHVRNYTIGDVIARYQRMQGKNVLHPMGWDAFGLPAENAAIQHQLAPAKWTYENINYMREQLKRLGFSFDWRREIATCKPEYYRWEQWFFIKLFEKGLVYKKSAMVNWDPVDQTILANEQVIDGRGWRSGALVERREIPQWFLKITAYAEELLNDLDKLTGWPDEVRTMQRNWIGRSEGATIQFEVVDEQLTLEVFTTRADTLMGVTYLAIAPQHPLAEKAAAQNKALQNFIEECRAIPTAEAVIATLEKRGLDTGLKAKHPLTGDLIPIWVANFVVMDYGSGAVMSVPAHDERDFEFAQKYKLPIKQVIKPADQTQHDFNNVAFTAAGILINSGEFNDLTSEQARQTITDYLSKINKGSKKLNYRLRDWSVSRQRYWGTPVPIINCNQCGAVAVPEQQLPVILPEDITFTGAASPLKSMPEFYEVNCPKCGIKAQRETDTFDTFMESSWYYARYTCKNQDKAMLDDRAKYWLPVDQYIGGIEHAVMHLLYARFYHKLLRDAGLVNSDEPFTRLLTQGMVLKDGAKMSKSKGNTVDPNHLIDKYGADTVRLFVMFAAPPEQSLEWSDSGVEGAYRFLKRLWNFGHQQQAIALNSSSKSLDSITLKPVHANYRRQIHELLQQARYDYERQQFNTVVSSSMKILNLLQDLVNDQQNETTQRADGVQFILYEGFSILLRLLAPITPHITHALWQAWHFDKLIIDAKFPKPTADALKIVSIELVVQVNGKLRGQITIDADANEETIKNNALNNPQIQRHLEGKPIKKIIVVPKKLVNIVL
jgi:leucyl-tRNA synthetase